MSINLATLEQIKNSILETVNNLLFGKEKIYISLSTKMELKTENRETPKENDKRLTGVTEDTIKSSKHIHEFILWYKENFSAKPSVAKNCILKATIISVWPPYGLALPKEAKYFDVGVILFHQSRIIETPHTRKFSGRVNIRSKNISKYGIYNTKRSWPKHFQTGRQILIRIPLSLNECSDRWRKQDKRDKKLAKKIKLSDIIHYKAVKLWSSDQDLNYIPQDEPVLRRRSVKFDQMQQLYIQWSINTDFCLEQLLGCASRRLLVEVLTDHPSCDKLSSMLLKCELYTNAPATNTAERIKMSKANSREIVLKTSPSMSMENDGNDIITGNQFKCDNPVWSELEPVEDDNDTKNVNEDSGILNLDNSISQRL